jgi:hypothetical protein
MACASIGLGPAVQICEAELLAAEDVDSEFALVNHVVVSSAE